MMSILSPVVTGPSLGVLTRLVAASLLGALVALIYRRTRPARDESSSFTITLVLLAILIAMVTQVIGDNVARAFSLVGALSIVRFRTAIKDPRDVGFVFAALALGMGCGTGFYLQSLVFTLFLCGLLLLLSKLSVGKAESNEAIVRVTAADGAGVAEALEAALQSADARPVLINRVHEEKSRQQTLSWRVRTGEGRAQGELQERLRKVEGVAAVGVYVMDDFNVL